MLESIDWGSVLNIVLAIFTTVAGGLWLKAKGKLSQLRIAAKESYEAIEVIVAGLADDKLTAEEQVAIKKEAGEAWVAIKVLLGIKPKEVEVVVA